VSEEDAAELDAESGAAAAGSGLDDGVCDGSADLAASEVGAVLPTSAASMDAVQLKHLVEALVFAADKPLTLVRLRQLTRVSDTKRLEQALADVTEDFRERGIILQQVSGGYQFRTRTQFSGWVQQLIAGRPVRLSRAQLETLAIIAYRQPITRPEIDEIRGVDSSATLKLLIDRALIRILGKKEEVGRPMLYGTTKEFLDFFSLGDLRELPTLREYSELTDESRQVMSARLGIDLDDTPRAVDTGDDDGGGGDGGGGSSGGGFEPGSLGSDDMPAGDGVDIGTAPDASLSASEQAAPNEDAGAHVEAVAADDGENAESPESHVEAASADDAESHVEAASADDAESHVEVASGDDAGDAGASNADPTSSGEGVAVDDIAADAAVVGSAEWPEGSGRISESSEPWIEPAVALVPDGDAPAADADPAVVAGQRAAQPSLEPLPE
jgi:segregation and condensation protein B